MPGSATAVPLVQDREEGNGVLNVLLGSVLGLERMWFFHPENAGISRVVADAEGRVRLGSVNETRQLPAA